MARARILGGLGLSVLAAALAALPGCSAEEDEAESTEGAVSGGLRQRFSDLRNVNTDNLSRIVATAGAEQVNKALKIQSKYAELDIHVDPPSVFGVQAEENSVLPNSAKVKSITDIRSTLAKDFGENELPTELSSARLAYLQGGADKYYVETGFGLGAGVGLSWTHEAGGFGDDARATIGVGFKKNKKVSTRVVVATPSSSLKELAETSGEGIMTMRGFVLPEKAENIKAMKPGEMIALKGEGTLAANFGVGIPILIADAGPFAYTIAVSAGLTHAVNGTLDMQLVRLKGDEVVVEVGVSDATLDQQSIGISGGWGVNALCDDGAACLTSAIGKIVKKGLVSRLDGFMKTSISASRSSGDHRIQLARMRFHMDQPEVSEALAQAMHGDLRYAQALYSRDLSKAEPSVKFDFDMMRASTTNTRNFGAQVFGLDIFHKYSTEKTGSFAIQTPDGVQSVLWNSFEKRSGWFQMDHGSKLTALSSAAVDATSPDKAQNRANLIGQSIVGDKHMDDDVILDSADAMIASFAGEESLAPLAKYGDAMQKAISQNCATTRNEQDRETWDEACNVKLLENEQAVVAVDGTNISIVEARKRGVDAFKSQSKITSLDPKLAAVLAKAAELHLTLCSVKIHNLDAANGPQVSFAVNYRFDDKALSLLSQVDVETYKSSVARYLGVVGAARVGFKNSPLEQGKIDGAATAMANELTRFQKRYSTVAPLETNDLPSVLGSKPYVHLPIGIRFDVSDVANAEGEGRMQQYLDDVKRIRVESFSHVRAMLAVDLFNALSAAAEDKVGFKNGTFRLFAEQAATYPLLNALPSKNLEVGMDVAANVQSNFWMKRDRFVKAGFQATAQSARGSDVEPIANKMFDLDAMMSAR